MKPSLCPNCGSMAECGHICLPGMPVLQNSVMKIKEDAMNIPKGEIRIAVCEQCGQIFNAAFQPELVVYDANYDNSQQHSAAFKRHLTEVEERIAGCLDLSQAAVMEVGCGKGAFIRNLAEHYACRCFAFDPSYVSDGQAVPENLTFYQQYFPPDGVELPLFHLIIIRHVIEHLQSPMDMVKMLSRYLAPQGCLYVETPDLHWIIENGLLFDFTFEHCSYFTPHSLCKLMTLCELSVVECRTLFAGQYLCLMARKDSDGALLDRLDAFEKGKDDKIRRFSELTSALKEKGGVALWGAAGKGVMFCNIFDPERKHINCVVDINANKQGAFIPGTGHAIVAPEEIAARNIKSIIVMNSNYWDEISRMAREIDKSMEIISAERLWDR